MTEPSGLIVSPFVRFPSFTDLNDLNSLSIVVQDLSTIYDVTSLAVLPGYERVLMPTVRLGTRRFSPLRGEDRLLVKSVSLSSPLEITFFVASTSGAVGVTAVSFDRVARAVKAWIDVLSAGLNIQQRKQALDQSRSLAPLQLREAELRNMLLEEQVRRVTTPPESDLMERGRETMRDLESSPDAPPPLSTKRQRPVGSMNSREFAELLGDPVNRLLSYAGGELEVAGNQEELPPPGVSVR